MQTKSWIFLIFASVLFLGACSGSDKKALGEPCKANGECAEEICHRSICVTRDPAKKGETCKVDRECRSFVCKGGVCAQGTLPLGELCRFHVECASNRCGPEGSFPGTCQAMTPDGGADAGVDAMPDAAADLAQDAPLPDAEIKPDAKPDIAADLAQDAPSPDTKIKPDVKPDAKIKPDARPDATISPDLFIRPDVKPDASCGGEGEICCAGKSCGANLSCNNSNICACGDKGQACCLGVNCNNTSLTCDSSKKCACGGRNQACCGGTTCKANLGCDSNKMCVCGGLYQSCCASSSCGGSLLCAGKGCGCVKKIEGVYYLRSDGTAWLHLGSSNTLITKGGPPLLGVTDIASGRDHGCAVAGGEVWCWGTSNQFGQIGNGTVGGAAPGSTSATRVKTGPSTYLKNIVSLGGSGYSGYGPNTNLAVASDGSLWCWGHSTAASHDLCQTGADTGVAVKIKINATTPLTGVKAATLIAHHACAVVGASVYCWGYGLWGALGTGNTSDQKYPTKALLPAGKTALKVTSSNSTSCALVAGGELYCWGNDSSRGVLGLGYATGVVNTPTLLRTSLTGPAFIFSDVELGYMNGCAIKADGTLWCWGAGYGPNYKTYVVTPTQQKRWVPKTTTQVLIDDAHLLTIQGGNTPNFRFVRTNGEYWLPSSKETVTCP